MKTRTHEYKNGSRAIFEAGGCGRMLRLENVPRVPFSWGNDERAWLSSRWTKPADGNLSEFICFEKHTPVKTLGGVDFEVVDLPIVNRHSFDVRESYGGVAYPGKYWLHCSELEGGWYLTE